MPDGPCPEWIVTCGTCHRVLEWFVCKTNDNGNQGKWMVRCVGGASGCFFFRTAYGKNGTPLQTPELSQGESQSPPRKKRRRGKGKCRIRGCPGIRINAKCGRRVCARHCRGLGGCGLKDHTPLDQPLTDDDNLEPDAHESDRLDNEVLELSDNLTDEEEDLPPPAPVVGLSNGKGKTKGKNRAIPPRKPTSESNTQPKHSLQLPPLFTAQLEQEHDLDEKQRQRDAVRIKSSQRAKYSVTVHAFVQNGEPPSSFVFQTGFQWPYFYLTYEVLCELDLPASNLDDGYQPSKLRLFDPSARAWRGIHQDHMITLQSHEESLILRASDVTDCAGLDLLLRSRADPIVPNIREHLHADRASVRTSNRAHEPSFVEPQQAELALPARLRLPPPSPVLPTSSSELEVEILLERASSDEPTPSTSNTKLSQSPVHPPASPHRRLVRYESVEIVHPVFSPLASQAASKPDTWTWDISPSPLHLSQSPSSWHPSPSPPARSPSPRRLEPPPSSLTPPPTRGSAWTSHGSTPSDAIDLDDVKVWPADFHVVNVVEGFRRCEIARKSRRVSVQKAFESYFGVPFKKTTFHEHRTRWFKAPQALCDKYLEARRTDRGLWSAFMREYRAQG
ncbi:hypothetical protein DEU56DRAFT_983117 [Suillus clintonianus]|uniref:uncharacterized protein n=1 Tax=Suillus clintonianus TaxID=1904413 RepID=UPI001B86BDEC|nr:uncharacterized protein DEU56DRAFT_983117 [Suillus clintonianus]KAG2125807.1 hypothetical protein DEU56DRAFT_983117 [Suillus clintonianus]